MGDTFVPARSLFLPLPTPNGLSLCPVAMNTLPRTAFLLFPFGFAKGFNATFLSVSSLLSFCFFFSFFFSLSLSLYLSLALSFPQRAY